jgi:hypothetical protein
MSCLLNSQETEIQPKGRVTQVGGPQNTHSPVDQELATREGRWAWV